MAAKETVRCVHPDCDHEIGDPDRLKAFIEAGRHADEDHGPEVKFVRTWEDGWQLQYQPSESASNPEANP